MARPQKRILRQTLQPGTWRQLSVIQSDGFWIVVYRMKPFTLSSELVDRVFTTSRVYPKLGYANPGHAYSLARKLNDWFNCEDFTVAQVA
jgi:hypothetical protein